MILSERIRLPYPWVKSKSQSRELLRRLSLVEDQEESELFLFGLYLDNKEDLQFFNDQEKERVKGYLRFLIEDSRRHKDILNQIMEEVRAVLEAEHEF